MNMNTLNFLSFLSFCVSKVNEIPTSKAMKILKNETDGKEFTSKDNLKVIVLLLQ